MTRLLYNRRWLNGRCNLSKYRHIWDDGSLWPGNVDNFSNTNIPGRKELESIYPGCKIRIFNIYSLALDICHTNLHYKIAFDIFKSSLNMESGVKVYVHTGRYRR